MTPLDALIDALESAGRYDPEVQARPEAVVWCDPEASFAPLASLLRARGPDLHTLGSFDQSNRTCPSFGLRVAIAEAEAAGSAPPILWLPRVSREDLRAASTCPSHLEPLAWLVAAGAFFGHVNGKDWTLRAFLTAERGPLHLDIADGPEAREALALAATQLFTRPVAALTGRRFDAEALHALAVPDLIAEMLEWMEGRLDPGLDPDRFRAFALRATRDLGLDPRKRSRDEATALMAARNGAWGEVWGRFEGGVGEGYGEIIATLQVVEPPGGLFEQDATFPAVNARAEYQLRSALLGLVDLDQARAAARIVELDGQHGPRRATIWARRGEAPLASALEHLLTIAQAPPWPQSEAKTFGDQYAARGAAVDQAALAALAAAPAEADRAAVATALGAIYLPWLDAGANALQELAARGEIPFGAIEMVSDDVGAVVFVDGLRFDLAQRLLRHLEAHHAQASLRWRWSGFPTSTASCKPLVSPVADLLTGNEGAGDVLPRDAEGHVANQPTLRRLMAERGFGFDENADGRIWLEVGTFDEDGHKLGARLASQVEQGIRDAADCILRLARGGRRVRVVTDHGWLLMPGGLPKANLGAGLVEPDAKRTRYARLKSGATTNHAQAAWSWNREVRLAMAPGASSFYAGYEYAHGGVSAQECVVPVIDVEPLSVPRAVEITTAQWSGLRLRVQAAGASDLRIDLRATDDPTGGSLLPSARSLDEAGRGSMVVPDEFEGRDALLVVLDDDGRILARKTVTVGG